MYKPSPEELAEWVKRIERNRVRHDELAAATIQALKEAGEARLKLDKGEKLTEEENKRLGMNKNEKNYINNRS
jgi:ribosomal protein L16 Arg81 hydroxylase